MSAPNPPHPGRAPRRRWRTGLAVAVAVAVVALAVLALLPRSATASASLTVTPRTDAGAGAALLLADRYTALAGSTGTLRAAREAAPALSDLSLDELGEGTTVERARDAATITVRVTLPERDVAVAAANAVVDELVRAGSDEELVDVDPAAEATASRAGSSPDLLRWALVVVPLALGCGLAAALTGRFGGRAATGGPATSPALGAAPAEVIDDLPGFLENPPGSIPVLPRPSSPPPGSPPPALAPLAEARVAEAPVAEAPVAEAPVAEAPVDEVRTGATAVPAGGHRTLAVLSRHGAATATATAVVLLIAVAALVGVTGGRSGHSPATTAATVRADAAPTTRATPTNSTAPVPTSPAPGSTTDTPAAALAFASVPLGRKGMAAVATFRGVVLEQRAVGLTVTYPSVSVTTDGRRSLAHVRLPTFNCLSAEPPADPVAAGCARSLTEYADLADPGLRVTRDGERIDLTGSFRTYTRPNGSAPAYTGREYQLAATIAADDPERTGHVPAVGVVRIGLDSAPTTADRGVNSVQVPG